MSEYIRLSLESIVYSFDAVKRAAFDLSNVAYFKFISNDNQQIVLDVKLTDDAPFDTLDIFFNKIVDHQLRIDLISQFGTLREIIVAQAFAPCDSIKDLLELQKQN